MGYIPTADIAGSSVKHSKQVKVLNQTEKLAFEYFNTRPGLITGKPKIWRLYYGIIPAPIFESVNYGHCRAEIKRQLKLGIYKKDLFKIK